MWICLGMYTTTDFFQINKSTKDVSKDRYCIRPSHVTQTVFARQRKCKKKKVLMRCFWEYCVNLVWSEEITRLALGCNYSNDYRTTGKLWDIQSSDLWGKDLCLSDHSGTNSVYAHRDKALQTIKASRDDCSGVTSHLSQKQTSRYTKWAFKTTEKPKSDSRLSSIREIQCRWLSTTNSKQPGWLRKQYIYEIC